MNASNTSSCLSWRHKVLRDNRHLLHYGRPA